MKKNTANKVDFEKGTEETKIFRVLLIEDNIDDEMLMLRAIKRIGAKIVTEVIRDGGAAISYLNEMTSIPHLIIADLKLPKLTGIEIIKLIKKNARVNFIPVVVLTSSTEPNDIINSMRAGASCYIRKSIDMDKFTQELEFTLKFWMKMHQSPYLPSL